MSILNWLSFALQMILMILFPIGLAVFFHRRFHTPWPIFFIAAAFYLLNLLVQIPFLFAWSNLFAHQPLAYLAALTLTYAVCEETMRYLSFRVGRVMRFNQNANGALMAGTGHGSTESIVFALGAISTLLLAFFAPQALHTQGTSAAAILNAPAWTFLASGLSRILAIIVHLGCATLIVLAYRRTWRFYPLAILAHFLVDFTSFGAQDLPNGTLCTFVVFTIWAILSLVLLIRIRHTNILSPQQSQSQSAEKIAAVEL